MWFDVKSSKPTDLQLELLAIVEDADFDDLLDEHLSQVEVHNRLHASLREQKIPAGVLARRDRFRRERNTLPICRICKKEGDSTKHHFVNKWILRELEFYTQRWSNRTHNCIPVCIGCHRDLHMRDNGPVSIAQYLNEKEKAFAEAALAALAQEHPKLLISLARGENQVYEARLAKDWIEGLFRPETPEIDEYRAEVNSMRVTT